MISLNPSGFGCTYNEDNIKNLVNDKGGKKIFSAKRSRRARFYNVISCLHFEKEIKTFWTFTVPELQTDFENTDKFYSQQFQKLLENLRLRHKRNKKNNLENFVWVAEAQSRGNIHFHLVTSTRFLNVKYVNQYWAKLINSNASNCVDVQNLSKNYICPKTGKKIDNRIKNISAYFAKYMSKSQQDNKDLNLKNRVIYCKSFGYSKNFKIYDKLSINPYELIKYFPELNSVKITKKFNDVEIDYYFLNTFKVIEFLKNEEEKTKLSNWFFDKEI